MKNYHDGGEAIMEAFRNLRVDYIMSSPGSEWSPVWEAMARQTVEKNHGPQFLDCWHENVAVDMAMGYTAMTGRMQAVLVHAGVGLMQGSMAMLSARQAEIPMLVLSGESVSYGDQPGLAIEAQWYGGVSVGGADRFVGPVVKHASQVTHPDTLYQSLVRGGELAQRPQQGPVYLDVSLEAMLHEWRRPDNLREIPGAPKLQPVDGDVKAVGRLLAAASNPAIAVEVAGRDPDAFRALVELAEQWAIPVVGLRSQVTYAPFPQGHDLWQGWANLGVLQQSDLILLVGGRTPWQPPSKRPGKGPVVSIGDNPIKHHLAYQVLAADQYLEGDMTLALRALVKAAKPGKSDAARIKERRQMWARQHAAMAEEMAAVATRERNEKGISPIALASVAGETLPADTIYVDETITHMPMMRGYLPLETPQSFFRVTGGALGQGIASALGVKLAARDRPVVLFVGDGSFLYNPIIQALGASKEYDLPITIVVCNNQRYEAMRKGHVFHYPDGVSDTTKVHYGVNIVGPEYQDLAGHFGFHGAKVESVEAIAPALNAAMAANKDGRTSILNVMLTK
ncbi:MAG: thiamine pyrophosphate-binding protein [Hyphomicrobiaceae bacterium]